MITSNAETGLLAGKRILVTGAASGIGLGSARFFRAQGALVVAADRDVGALDQAWSTDAGVPTMAVEVTDETSCEALMRSAIGTLEGLDGVFNSAGVSDVVAPAVDLDVDDWQRVVDVNLRGTFLVARAAGRHMLAAGSGSIVTMSSVNGIGGIPRRHAYGPAKAAVAQLTRTLACEWGPAQVRINALAPTYIRTPMVDRLIAEDKINLGRLERRTPLGRIGEVEDVARAAAFLLSDWSSYITGTILPVDGGWLAYGGPGDVATA